MLETSLEESTGSESDDGFWAKPRTLRLLTHVGSVIGALYSVSGNTHLRRWDRAVSLGLKSMGNSGAVPYPL